MRKLKVDANDKRKKLRRQILGIFFLMIISGYSTVHAVIYSARPVSEDLSAISVIVCAFAVMIWALVRSILEYRECSVAEAHDEKECG